MADMKDLETRIRVLEDIEAIKKLKAQYFQSIDRKRWDDLAECFCQDGVWESFKRKVKVDGLSAIVQFIRNIEDGDHIINTHLGHNPKIEITSDTTATGIWELSHYRDDLKEKKRQQSAAFYEDIYVKEKGTWRVKYSKIIPIYLNETPINTISK
jgi:hypothetical protein